MAMKGLVLKAEWQPRKDYSLSDFEKETKKVVTASSVYRDRISKSTQKSVNRLLGDFSVKVPQCYIDIADRSHPFAFCTTLSMSATKEFKPEIFDASGIFS